jgi:Cu(I)/Ag(I) efflux system membrane fusion protein
MNGENPATVTPKPSAAKRRYGFGSLVLVAALSGAIGALAVSGAGGMRSHDSRSAQHDAAIYHCPMHPTVVQDHPGNCPICGMKLVKVEKGQSVAPPPTASLSGVPGLSSVEIDAARQQLIGLKTAEVSEGTIGGTWRSVGRVAVDETRVRRVSLKVPGFVERIYVDYVGKKVKKGDPLFAIYSPELLSTQEEYLLAQKTQKALAKVGGGAGTGEEGLAADARRKLELWDIPAGAVDKLTEAGRPSKTLTIYSPVAGVVTKKEVVEGMKLDAGAMPYEIVDLSRVWVLVDVYESELRFIEEGMSATLTLSAFPNREFEGKVVFLEPLLDPQTRTVKARLTFANPGGELRPEMCGEVVLRGSPQRGLQVPLDAVIDSGTKKLVFVALGEGKFEPRAVEVGQSDGAHVVIKSGLRAGERVVVRANFLVDSESRLRASLSAIGAEGPARGAESARVLPAPAASHGGHP